MTTKIIDTPAGALDFFLDLACHHVGGCSYDRWRNLHFEPSGISRMACTVGTLFGWRYLGPSAPLERLATAGRSPDSFGLAEALAWELWQALERMNTHGGEMDTPVDEGRGRVSVPYYRTVLTDDGTYGNFSFLRYSAIEPAKYQAALVAAESKVGAGAFGDAREIVHKQLQIREDLTQERYFVPAWVKEARKRAKTEGRSTSHLSGDRAYIYYGYGYNGGLILHGLDESKPRYSTHT